MASITKTLSIIPNNPPLILISLQTQPSPAYNTLDHTIPTQTTS
jgi:hypothetical protein